MSTTPEERDAATHSGPVDPATPRSRAESRRTREASAKASRDKRYDEIGSGGSSAASSDRANDYRGNDYGVSQGDDRAEHDKHNNTAATWASRILTIVAIWAIWALISTFLVQPFKIPSPSMADTLPVGDRIIVNKLHSGEDVKRGDVVVFADDLKWEGEPVAPSGLLGAIRKVAEVTHLSASGTHLVKRVIGLPGDTVACTTGGKLKVNGVAVNEPYVRAGVSPCDSPNGISDWTITVPADHAWVMGDNRTDSADSRWHDANSGGKMGSIPLSSVTGEVVAVAWPLNHIGGSVSNEDAFAKVPSKNAK